MLWLLLAHQLLLCRALYMKLLLAVCTADGQSGPALLAACAARRWLAHNATRVTRMLRSNTRTAALAATSLVSCLPALERVELRLYESLTAGDLRCLLEALAWCPRLRVLGFYTETYQGRAVPQAFPDMPKLMKQRGLKALALNFRREIFAFASMMDAVVSLTGLIDLNQEHLETVYEKRGSGCFADAKAYSQPCMHDEMRATVRATWPLLQVEMFWILLALRSP